MRWVDMQEIGSLLDDTIEKGSGPLSKVERFEQALAKSLSHDPFAPHLMGAESPYYNPYRQLDDGGFAPHPVEYWESQGRNAGDYRSVHEYYRDAGVKREDQIEREHAMLQLEIARRFRSLAKSSDEMISKAMPAAAPAQPGTKSGRAVPVGTVHTYSDGQQYKKVAEGQWVPVAGREQRRVGDILQHPDPKLRSQAHAEMERHAAKTLAVSDELKKRQRDQEVVEQAKHAARQEVVGHMKNVISKLFDGKMPPEIEKQLAEAQHGPAKDGPSKLDREPMEGVESADQPAKNAQGIKHAVEVEFSYGGQTYARKFNTHARSPMDAQKKVHEALVNRLGRGVQVSRLSAQVHKEGEAKPKENTKSAESRA